MQVCDHISDDHLCFDSAFTCPKLLTTLNIQVFSLKSSTPLRNYLYSSPSVFGGPFLTFTSYIFLSPKVFIKYLY